MVHSVKSSFDLKLQGPLRSWLYPFFHSQEIVDLALWFIGFVSSERCQCLEWNFPPGLCPVDTHVNRSQGIFMRWGHQGNQDWKWGLGIQAMVQMTNFYTLWPLCFLPPSLIFDCLTCYDLADWKWSMLLRDLTCVSWRIFTEKPLLFFLFF